MAKINGKGHDEQEQILAELRALNKRIGGVDDRIGGLREDLTMRLDKVIENTGSHWRELERKVEALESKQPK